MMHHANLPLPLLGKERNADLTSPSLPEPVDKNQDVLRQAQRERSQSRFYEIFRLTLSVLKGFSGENGQSQEERGGSCPGARH